MDSTVVAAWIAAGVSLLTLIGTVITQRIGFRSTSADTEKKIQGIHEDTADTLKQQREQLQAQSDQLGLILAAQRTRTLNERFATAAEQMGDDKPPIVRLVGVRAMAGLADDWPESRQACVDVLCDYLRMPYQPDPGGDASEPQQRAFQALRDVRHKIIRVTTGHLQKSKDDPASWQRLDLDFTGVVFDGGDFGGARFSGGQVSFEGARFSGGRVDFEGARFSGGQVNFKAAQFSSGTVSFRYARFSGSKVDFSRAEFSGGTVDFSYAGFSDDRVSFESAQISDGMLFFLDAEFSGGMVEFTSVRFFGGTATFFGAEFSGSCKVSFISAQFSGSTVSFSGAKFPGGEVSFALAKFSSAPPVDFSHAKFSDGKVDFSEAGDWSVLPVFPWTGTPPPGVKLPRSEDQPGA
jgi:uncharacterized protein YjbI with pentapeptide repeats